jgi:hypothetical protein
MNSATPDSCGFTACHAFSTRLPALEVRTVSEQFDCSSLHQLDRHLLVRLPDVLERLANAVPSQILEEFHIRNLDIRHHQISPALARGPDGKAYQRSTQRQLAEWRQHGKSISFPQSGVVQRVETNNAAQDTATQAQYVQGGRVVVVAVAIRTLEQPLFPDEHFLSHAEMKV